MNQTNAFCMLSLCLTLTAVLTKTLSLSSCLRVCLSRVHTHTHTKPAFPTVSVIPNSMTLSCSDPAPGLSEGTAPPLSMNSPWQVVD
uniref:Secreted protein n=1 Tax=Electrophorus electricus TaxID=8005 RepID=A0AAY5EWF9_ELEEL